jgi:hypothetical protein
MTRQYIKLPNPTPDAIRNAATKNPAGTWVIYGSADLDIDPSVWEFTRPSDAVMQSVRDCADKGWIRVHQKKGDNGLSEYVFVVLGDVA